MSPLFYEHNLLKILLVYASTTKIGFSKAYSKIESAVSGPIPFRFRRAVGARIDAITNRDRSPNDLSFFNEYMDGLYTQRLVIDAGKKSQITIWMIENNITEWHIIGNVIWFKNDEDAMAVKLGWME